MAVYAGFGATLKRGDGQASETFTAIAQVEEITLPTFARDTIETSDHESTDRYREYIGGLRDAGEFSAVVNYDPANTGHEALFDDFDTNTAVNYQIVLPDTDATTWQFSALVTNIESASPRDGKMTASVTFKISGKPNRDA